MFRVAVGEHLDFEDLAAVPLPSFAWGDLLGTANPKNEVKNIPAAPCDTDTPQFTIEARIQCLCDSAAASALLGSSHGAAGGSGTVGAAACGLLASARINNHLQAEDGATAVRLFRESRFRGENLVPVRPTPHTVVLVPVPPNVAAAAAAASAASVGTASTGGGGVPGVATKGPSSQHHHHRHHHRSGASSSTAEEACEGVQQVERGMAPPTNMSVRFAAQWAADALALFFAQHPEHLEAIKAARATAAAGSGASAGPKEERIVFDAIAVKHTPSTSSSGATAAIDVSILANAAALDATTSGSIPITFDFLRFENDLYGDSMSHDALLPLTATQLSLDFQWFVNDQLSARGREHLLGECDALPALLRRLRVGPPLGEIGIHHDASADSTSDTQPTSALSVLRALRDVVPSLTGAANSRGVGDGAAASAAAVGTNGVFYGVAPFIAGTPAGPPLHLALQGRNPLALPCDLRSGRHVGLSHVHALREDHYELPLCTCCLDRLETAVVGIPRGISMCGCARIAECTCLLEAASSGCTACFAAATSLLHGGRLSLRPVTTGRTTGQGGVVGAGGYKQHSADQHQLRDRLIASIYPLTARYAFLHRLVVEQFGDVILARHRHHNQHQQARATAAAASLSAGGVPTNKKNDTGASYPTLSVQLQCSQCESTSCNDLWVCLICGLIGCSRYRRRHAQAHGDYTGHAFSLCLATQDIWDYDLDAFVHRWVARAPPGLLGGGVSPSAGATRAPTAAGGISPALSPGAGPSYAAVARAQTPQARPTFAAIGPAAVGRPLGLGLDRDLSASDDDDDKCSAGSRDRGRTDSGVVVSGSMSRQGTATFSGGGSAAGTVAPSPLSPPAVRQIRVAGQGTGFIPPSADKTVTAPDRDSELSRITSEHALSNLGTVGPGTEQETNISHRASTPAARSTHYAASATAAVEPSVDDEGGAVMLPQIGGASAAKGTSKTVLSFMQGIPGDERHRGDATLAEMVGAGSSACEALGLSDHPAHRHYVSSTTAGAASATGTPGKSATSGPLALDDYGSNFYHQNHHHDPNGATTDAAVKKPPAAKSLFYDDVAVGAVGPATEKLGQHARTMSGGSATIAANDYYGWLPSFGASAAGGGGGQWPAAFEVAAASGRGGGAAASPATTTQRLLVDAKLEWESERACFSLTSQLMDHLRTQRDALRLQAQDAVAAATAQDIAIGGAPPSSQREVLSGAEVKTAAVTSGGRLLLDAPDAPLFALEAATVRAHFHNAVAADRARNDLERLQAEVDAMAAVDARTRGATETLKESLRVVLERKQQLEAAVAARRRELRATIEEVRANVRVRQRLGAAGLSAGDADMAAMMVQPSSAAQGRNAAARRRR